MGIHRHQRPRRERISIMGRFRPRSVYVPIQHMPSTSVTRQMHIPSCPQVVVNAASVSSDILDIGVIDHVTESQEVSVILDDLSRGAGELSNGTLLVEEVTVERRETNTNRKRLHTVVKKETTKKAKGKKEKKEKIKAQPETYPIESISDVKTVKKKKKYLVKWVGYPKSSWEYLPRKTAVHYGF